MKEYVVLLPFDTEAFRNEKIDIIRRLVGEDNVSYYGDINDHTIPNVTIRCNKKTWKKVKFQMGLCKAYW